MNETCPPEANIIYQFGELKVWLTKSKNQEYTYAKDGWRYHVSLFTEDCNYCMSHTQFINDKDHEENSDELKQVINDMAYTVVKAYVRRFGYNYELKELLNTIKPS